MISTIDMAIVAAFMIATLGIGLRIKNHDNSTHGFLLGGRALTLPAFVATTVSTWYGGILGVGEYTWRYGISNWFVFGVPYYVGALLFASLLSKKAQKGHSLTIPERFEQHYNAPVAKCAATLIFLTTVPGAYILMMASLCAVSFNLSLPTGVAITTVFVILYLWRGGFSAVVKTDAIQFALMFAGFVILSIWLIASFGFSPLQSLPPSHTEITGGQSISAILVWYLIALSTLAEPNFFQRCFAAKTPQIAQKGLIISVFFWLFFDIMTTLCGLYARALLPNLANPVNAFPALATHVLPVGFVGLFFAGMFATILSSLDSNLFTSATTLGRDIWPKKFHTIPTPTRTRIGLVIAAAIAAAIALASGSVIKIWKIFGSVSAASLLLPILATYYSPLKLTSKGTLILMVASAVMTIFWFCFKSFLDKLLFPLEPLFAGAITAIIIFSIDKSIQFKRALSSAKNT